MQVVEVYLVRVEFIILWVKYKRASAQELTLASNGKCWS